jgi:N-methylhydantoinase B
MTEGRNSVRMALLSARFDSIARKMANTLFRSARSGVIAIGRDFSCCIVTRDHELLVSAESLPIHVLSGPDEMSRTMQRFHADLRPGDAFLHNSPYHGGSHAADHTILAPVVDETGAHRFTVVAKAHQADCGNSQPTTYMGGARDVYEEGALIFPAVRVQRDYRDVADIIRMCEMRIRVPEQWWGDYLASLGAVRIAERELLALGEEVGWDSLERHAEAWFDYSEGKMIEAIRRLKSSKATTRAAHDPIPGLPEGISIKVDVEVDAEAGTITVDLRDNPDCQPCGLNLTQGTASTAAMVGIYNAILDHTVPTNAGSFRRITLKLRENCAVGIPRHPFSCSVATTNLADRVANCVQRAIAQIAPGFGLAETGPSQPPGMGVISGLDPRHGNAPFVNQVFIGVTGGAATAASDAFMTIIDIGNAGLCRHDSIEVDELHHPLHIVSRHIVPDTEGAGQYRGAPSMISEFGPTPGCTMKVLYTSDGTINHAIGVLGGGGGGPSRALKRELDGSLTTLPACYGVTLEPGEYVVSYSSGGGGYGKPTERDPALVMHDLQEGWITAERARSVYGVETAEGTEAGVPVLDEAATRTLRASLTAP